MEQSSFLWLRGQRYVALRLTHQDRYRLIPWQGEEPFAPTPGIILSLEQRHKGPLAADEVRTLTRRGFIALPFPLPLSWIRLFSILPLLLLIVLEIQKGWTLNPALTVPFLGELKEFSLYLLFAVLTVGALLLYAGASCAAAVEGNAPVYGFLWGLPWIEPVVYRVGLPAFHQYAPVIAALGLYLLGGVGEEVMYAGVKLGAALYLLLALFPLRPGPGARLLEELSGIPDVLPHIKLNLITRFLPVPSVLQSEGSGRVGLAALAVAVWFLLCGAVLSQLYQTPRGTALYNLFVLIGGVGGVIALGMWGLIYTGQLFFDALRLAREKEIQPFLPPAELTDRWLEESSLFYHIGELRKLPLRWYQYPPGSFLIRYGDEDRRFYWIVDGLVEVVGRTPLGDPILLAQLQGGCGVGEIAFLEARKRTADVVVLEPTIVVEVSYEDFAEKATPEVMERFREVVLSSQSLGRSRLFQNIPPHHRERWIRYGEPRRFLPGDTIIAEGELETWMGIVVRGEVEVWKGGELKAVLSQDDIFGEIAFLYRGPRTATLKARTPVLIWRWEGEWLEEEARKRGLIPVLEEIARSRL